MEIQENSTVLFQGDSITDAGRNRDDFSHLGTGYAFMAASLFNSRFSEMKVTFINKGISGNKAIDLEARWEEDCLKLKPDFVSILIGVNDMWRRYDSHFATSAKDYEKSLQKLLSSIKENLNARILLIEPFLLPVREEMNLWKAEDLNAKKEVVRKMVDEFETLFLPMDDIFMEYNQKGSNEFWASDGVHPTGPGHALIAQKWLDIVSG